MNVNKQADAAGSIRMQPVELLALRTQWRRISNEARAEFKLLSERNPEHPGSFSTTPVQNTKVHAAPCDAGS